MVTDTGGIDDRSFNASSWAGMQAAAAANPNITVKYLQSSTQSDYIPNINTFLNEKCGIIVTVVIGIVGAVIATYGGQALGLYAPGEPAGFIGSVLGAVVLLVLLRLFNS